MSVSKYVSFSLVFVLIGNLQGKVFLFYRKLRIQNPLKQKAFSIQFLFQILFTNLSKKGVLKVIDTMLIFRNL